MKQQTIPIVFEERTIVKLIAEMCQNHLGREEILRAMTVSAKESGATHAKIQGIYTNELNKRPEFENKDSKTFRPFEAEYSRLKPLELSEEEEKNFIDFCLEVDLTPMITVFTHTGAQRAKRVGFKSIKIASYDCASWPLIRNCMEFAEELFVSTGATPWIEVLKTISNIQKQKSNNQYVAILHARTLYPCELVEARLARMLLLKLFGFEVGFSDHSNPSQDFLLTSKLAIAMGAEVLERHFTILPREMTKDGPVSINSRQLKELSDFSFSSNEFFVEFKTSNSKAWELATKMDFINPSEVELRNAGYYRGRFASFTSGKPIYPWDDV